jgi:hypothetical protein
MATALTAMPVVLRLQAISNAMKSMVIHSSIGSLSQKKKRSNAGRQWRRVR